MRLTTSPSFIWFQPSSALINATSTPAGDLNLSIKVTLFPEWYKQITLQWEVPPSWAGAKFHVYFWPGGNEAYTRLTQSPTSNQFFSDTTTREYSKTQESYYIVEAYLPFTNQVVKSLPISWEYRRRDRVEKIANEIQRREYLLLSKFAGTKSFFFRKKNYGPRCTRCWSPSEEKIMDDHCEVCYGTSFNGGYFDPVPVFIQYTPLTANKVKSYQGTIEPSSLEAWTISFPQINSDDVIIRLGTWHAFRVIGSNPTELQTKAVRQMLSLTQLSKGDVENKLVDRIQRNGSDDYLEHFETKFASSRFPRNLLDKKPENDYKWAKEQDLTSLPSYKV